MPDSKANPFNRDVLAKEILQEWQDILNETAEMLGVPAGLITRVDRKEIEILLSSQTEGNPYPADAVAQYPDSGWYCEHTLKTKGLNFIANATKDPKWKDNSAVVDLNIISYTGMPIERPDGELFGTVCFLDYRQHEHNKLHIKMIEHVKRMVELTLKIIHDEAVLREKDKLLCELSKIYPICCYCKKVMKEDGNWVSIEKYVHENYGAKPSHGICPDCLEREFECID